jgi:transglutaminase-like putative cysteine protease
MLLMLYVHPDTATALQEPECIVVDPAAHVESLVDWFGNRAARIVAPPGTLRLRYDNVVQDSGRHEPTIESLRLAPVQELPPECWRYLLASRYCEVDRMSAIAWDLFGRTPETWERVRAVVGWVHDNVTFGYQYSRPTKTAFDVFTERQGVCRDFQHLAITFLRALNIPARYATGYLGDIGVPRGLNPMDFAAWLEVYLGDAWYTLDARHNQRRIGRVLMGRGRDAVDVALTTSFGSTTLTKFTVWTDELQPKARRADMSEATVATPEGRFTVDTAGPVDGPLVLLLHGYPQTRHTWRHQVPALGAAGPAGGAGPARLLPRGAAGSRQKPGRLRDRPAGPGRARHRGCRGPARAAVPPGRPRLGRPRGLGHRASPFFADPLAHDPVPAPSRRLPP